MKEIRRSPVTPVENGHPRDAAGARAGTSANADPDRAPACGTGPAKGAPRGILEWFGSEGYPLPPGQSWIEEEEAYNFVLLSENAGGVTLLLYGECDQVEPLYTLELDYRIHKLRSIWFCKVARKDAGDVRYYGYRVSGPAPGGPDVLHAFDPEKILLDPYARAVWFPPGFSREAASHPGSTAGKAPLGVLCMDDPSTPRDDPRWRVRDPNVIIYEMHVGGFTQGPSSGVAPELRGTFAGVVEKIPHLKDLGITRVELMPVHQFDPEEGNYWGYMTLNFFAPHQQYASDRAHAREEFREMVDAFHEAGIEVILDVVYNHTTEADQSGPNYSFKGIDNSTYYLLSGDPNAPYADFSGTGNTLHCGSRVVRVLILESLRYWVTQMGVDGFRFDLASIFTRQDDGTTNLADSSLVSAIRADPVLRHVHLIAEPWDAGGAYQLGSHFPGQSWSQWNGQYRDDLRKFIKGDRGMVPTLMRRIYGSDDLFPDDVREACRPFHTVNYVNAHDGFTLYDLLAYDEKHNWANGHDNTDGQSDNYSWNCGWEGDEGAPADVLVLRTRQAKNLCALLMLSNGIPMFRAGDEFLQTQGGNNNPYNQDNATSWLDWTRLETHADVHRFFRLMIRFRKTHPTLHRTRFWRDDVRWYGVGAEVDLGDESHSLAYCLRGGSLDDVDLYVMINAYWEPLTFAIQEGSAEDWSRVVDTALASPEDIAEDGTGPRVPSLVYEVQARSLVVLARQGRPTP
ncbi:glycogen debranching protein [Singulisphaera sp. PoT]|uniref:glycogen debranching protein n=1 Tax=Singulisphaera sp. PoT TaxID=3411797 RepID=UPI003BF4604E